jgi:hypothetical protein
MSIGRVLPTARNLWREQPRWRWTIIVAVVSTLGVVATGGYHGAGGGQGSTPPGSYAPTTVSGGGGAPNVIMPVAPTDLDADKRLRAFYQGYVDADAHKAQAGLRCEKLMRAYAGLSPDDERSAKPAQVNAIDEAKRCMPLMADSDQRIAGVQSVLQRFKQAPTLPGAEEVDAAAATLTDFDRSRDLSVKGIAIDQLDHLNSAVASYQQLLERMATLAPLYRPHDPATLATTIELAKLRQDAAALPIGIGPSGLTASQQQALAAAVGADEAIRASDHKIGVLQEAFSHRSADPVGLTIALGALDGFDRARLDAAQAGLNLQEVENAARTSVGEAITRLAGDYSKAASFDNASMLTQLATLAGSLKADIPGDAKAIVARAQVDLDGSAKRLKALNDVAGRWQQLRAQGTRDPAVEARVNQVMAAIVSPGSVEPNPFDAAAMTAQDRAALGTLVAARIEIQGQLLPGQRRAVTIALRGPPSADANASTFLADVAAELQRQGFAVTMGAGADATFVLSLSAPAIEEGGINSDGLFQRRASTKGTLQWSYSGRSADLGTITGVGVDRDKRVITEAALRAAAAEVGKTLLAKVQGA